MKYMTTMILNNNKNKKKKKKKKKNRNIFINKYIVNIEYLLRKNKIKCYYIII